MWTHMYQAAGHEWQQVEKHGMTSPATLTAVWGRYLIQGLHDVLSIWFFTFFFPGLYSDKYLLLFPGLGSLYFRPFVSNVKIQIPSRLVWRWRFRLVYFVWGDRFEPRLGHRLSWLFFFFCGFPQSFQASSLVVPRFGHGGLDQNQFMFFIQ